MFNYKVEMSSFYSKISDEFKISIIKNLEQLNRYLCAFKSADTIPAYELFLCKLDFLIFLLFQINFNEKNEEKEIALFQALQFLTIGNIEELTRLVEIRVFDIFCDKFINTSLDLEEIIFSSFNIIQNFLITDSQAVFVFHKNHVFKYIIKICDDLIKYHNGFYALSSLFNIIGINICIIII